MNEKVNFAGESQLDENGEWQQMKREGVTATPCSIRKKLFASSPL